jgi:hypothetical protein
MNGWEPYSENAYLPRFFLLVLHRRSEDGVDICLIAWILAKMRQDVDVEPNANLFFWLWSYERRTLEPILADNARCLRVVVNAYLDLLVALCIERRPVIDTGPLIGGVGSTR